MTTHNDNHSPAGRQAPDDVDSRLDALSSAAAQRASAPAMHKALDKVRRVRETGDGQVTK